MHRGSSKAGRGPPPPAEDLPLSASRLPVRIDVVRGRASTPLEVEVVPGTLVRDALRAAGLPPEGSAVLVEETPIPLDTPIDAPLRLIVVPTFSGG